MATSATDKEDARSPLQVPVNKGTGITILATAAQHIVDDALGGARSPLAHVDAWGTGSLNRQDNLLGGNCSVAGSAMNTPFGGSVARVRAGTPGDLGRWLGNTWRSASPDREGRMRDPMYVTQWSTAHAGIGFQFNESKLTVTYAGQILICMCISLCIALRIFHFWLSFKE